jgi:hypothetical protein
MLAAHPAQGPRRIEPRESPRESSTQSEYGTKFFDQLRSLFGRFRDADLQRAFDMAKPIQCSELISDSGEWRQVAFFNEDRRLGDWYHRTLEEVRGDLSLYIFKGPCKTEQSDVSLVTKFPVSESLNAYIADKIAFKDIVVNTNAAVSAKFDANSEAYGFELPYLYVDRAKTGSETVYSLIASRTTDRYATDVTNHWQCKSVRAYDVTFQFLICETWTSSPKVTVRSRSKNSFGSSAYFILSDGKEATTSVKISFRGTDNIEDAPAAPAPAESDLSKPADRPVDDKPVADKPVEVADVPTREGWLSPDVTSKLTDVDRHEFRIRFNTQSWENKVASPQFLMGEKLLSLTQAPTGSDYCSWNPASARLAPRVLGKDPDEDVSYTVNSNDGSRLSAASISFDFKTHNGSRIGLLQCFFRTQSATDIPINRWSSIVGNHLTLEIRP